MEHLGEGRWGTLLAALVCALLAACTSDPGAADAGACTGELFRCGSECVDTESDARHCGACDRACAPRQQCVAGRCEDHCAPGLADCDGDASNGCEVMLTTNREHCGACGRRCAPSDACVSGVCGCSGGLTGCGGRCVDAATSHDHCGMCNVSCGAGSCVAGRCICPTGLTSCEIFGCVDTASSQEHCGGCGVRCVGGSCVAGRCVCPPGYRTCGEAGCVDTSSDREHCGACGARCPVGSCVAGRCVCSDGRTVCDDACVDTTSDPMNCGACGNVCPAAPHAGPRCRSSHCALGCDHMRGDCNSVVADGCETDVAVDHDRCGACYIACRADQVCGYGVCRCPLGQTECGGVCADLLTSASHCGACGRACPAGWTCTSGGCDPPCAAPRARCGDACVDLTSDASHCGMCGRACAGGERCAAGACVAVPRPIAPLSTATALSARPLFRWQLPAGATGARVQVCRDRACATPTIDEAVSGTTWRPSSRLTPGTYFWRLFARSGAGTAATASVTWFFRVETRGEGAPSGAGVSGSTFDVNADGLADVAVGDPSRSDGPTGRPGRVHVYLGAARSAPLLHRVLIGPRNGDDFGDQVASAGDVNGDGYADLIVGAQWDPSTWGFFRIYLGGPAGISQTPQREVVAGRDMTFIGRSVASAGDVNGDGYGDVVVGSFGHARDPGRGPGAAFVYLGSASGIAATAAVTLDDPHYASEFGSSVAGAEDLNADGYSDVIVGAPGDLPSTTSIAGSVSVYLGSATGLSSLAHRVIGSPTPSPTDHFGRLVAGAGDLDGDGYSDFAVGNQSPYLHGGYTGGVYVFRGGAAGVSTTPAAVFTSGARDGAVGWSVAGAGDLNGDGYGDLVMGREPSASSSDAVTVHLGGAALVSVTPSLTLSVDDADWFGFSVAGAGDLDGDGLADLLVSSPRTRGARGAVYVFTGSASALSTAPRYTLVTMLETYDSFGTSLACAAPRPDRSTRRRT